MQSIKLRSRVNADGILRLEVPLELANQELDLIVVYEPVELVTSEEKASVSPSERAQAFREWVESHRGMNLPNLSDEAISRESIYGERG
jgi:hypothetical protein